MIVFGVLAAVLQTIQSMIIGYGRRRFALRLVRSTIAQKVNDDQIDINKTHLALAAVQFQRADKVCRRQFGP